MAVTTSTLRFIQPLNDEISQAVKAFDHLHPRFYAYNNQRYFGFIPEHIQQSALWPLDWLVRYDGQLVAGVELESIVGILCARLKEVENELDRLKKRRLRHG